MPRPLVFILLAAALSCGACVQGFGASTQGPDYGRDIMR